MHTRVEASLWGCRGVHDKLLGTFLALITLAEASGGGAYLAVVSDIFNMLQG